MRKFLLIALAGLGLTFAVPAAVSAAPVTQGEAIRIALDGVGPVENVRHRWWHCRWRSGYCGRRYYPRYRYRYVYPRRYYRYRYVYPRRYRW